MNLNRDKHFSFILKMIREAQKITDYESQKYYSLFENLVSGSKKLSDEDIDKINIGELKYQLFEKEKTALKKSSLALPIFNVESVINELNSCMSREEGEAVLLKYCNPKRRKDFEELLNYLKIHSKSSETISRLKDKIIENTISYRLRAEAIQNYGKK